MSGFRLTFIVAALALIVFVLGMALS